MPKKSSNTLFDEIAVGQQPDRKNATARAGFSIGTTRHLAI